MFKVSAEMVRDLLDTFNIELHFKFQIKNILGLFEKKKKHYRTFFGYKGFFRGFFVSGSIKATACRVCHYRESFALAVIQTKRDVPETSASQIDPELCVHPLL